MRHYDYLEIAEMMNKCQEEARIQFCEDFKLDRFSDDSWVLWDLVCESKEEKDFLSDKQWAAIRCDSKRFRQLLDEEDYEDRLSSYA